MMKKIFLLIYLTAVCLVSNNSATAQGGVLPLNGSVNGTLAISSTDTWDITTNTDGLLRISFTTVSPADLYVALYDNDGITVIHGPVESFNNSTATFDADGLAPGTYHVKITPFGSSSGAYTLSDNLFTSTIGNDTEPNGNIASASVLAVNGSHEGHVGYYYNNQRDSTDWYRVTTGSDGLLRVYLTTARGGVNSTNTLDVNLTLYDNDGSTQLGAVEVFNGSGPATNLITTDGLAPGTYYIKVQPYSTSEFANYTISDSLFIPTIGNDTEPNGSASGAVSIAVNGTRDGHVGYYYNQHRDTTDWYKVTTTSDGLLRVYLSAARGSVYSNNTLDVNMTLFDNDGTTQLGAVEVFNAGGPASNLITADGLQAGTYYIKVQPYSSSEFADYTISDSLFANNSNDIEPNGDRSTAIVLPVNDSSAGHVGYYYNHQRDTTDWYRITTTADGLLRVYLSTRRNSIYSGNALDVNVTLYDNDGSTQLGNVEVFNGNGPANNLITADGLAPGTYYIKVQPYSNSEFADYTISDSLFIPPVGNDAEPNGSVALAAPLLINTYISGHSGYYYNQQRDTTDWYKITLAATSPLYIYLNILRGSTFSNNPLDMILSLYDATGTTQLGSVEVYNAGGPGTNSLGFASLPAGDYYVKVNDYSTAEFGVYNLSVSGTNINLPVTFLDFNGLLKDNSALLNWSTATEINNKGFEVQKSLDGLNFIPIGFVQGSGTSSVVNTYHFTDQKLSGGYNYYRLKQVDLDGHFTYSSTIRLEYKKFNWDISGNPVSAASSLLLELPAATNIAIQVYSTDGKLIKTMNPGKMAEGSYGIPLQLGDVATGIYVVKLIADGQVFSKQVFK